MIIQDMNSHFSAVNIQHITEISWTELVDFSFGLLQLVKAFLLNIDYITTYYNLSKTYFSD